MARRRKSSLNKNKLSLSFKRKDNLDFHKRRKVRERGRYKGVYIFIVEIILVIALAYVTAKNFTVAVYTNNTSMDPTLGNGDMLFLDLIQYEITDPKTYDVIAFHPAGNANANISIKRVIGVPGDKVLIDNGRLYVNGELFADRTKTEYMDFAGIAAVEYTVKDNEFFCLGDNRNMSEDSRYESVGCVERDYIVGKVWIDLAPSHFGLIR